jgi:hypothetical protein
MHVIQLTETVFAQLSFPAFQLSHIFAETHNAGGAAAMIQA